MIRNETFTVAAIADCAWVLHNERFEDYLWRETEVGCKVLLLLQEMHHFNITYITGFQNALDYYERMGAVYEFDEAVDIYAKPRSLWSNTIYNASPVIPIFAWKFGFILRRPNPDIHLFYSLPFAPLVWKCIMAMILLVSVLFYVLNRAEQRLLGKNLDCYFFHELLMAIATCCQHYLPVNPMALTSRRIAFISFFLFSFILYSYYTSTLLSDLVHDKDKQMDLETLADSSYGHVVLDSTAVIIKVLIENLHSKNNNTKLKPPVLIDFKTAVIKYCQRCGNFLTQTRAAIPPTIFDKRTYQHSDSYFGRLRHDLKVGMMPPQLVKFIQKKLTNIHVVNISTGLAEVKTGNTALLSDYVSLYGAIKQTYDLDLECELIKVHLFSNVLKYFFTSKNFKYTEEFRVSTLWAKETGVLKRLLKTNMTPSPLLHITCNSSHFQAQFGLVKRPLIMLAFSYILCVLILLGERAYFRRHRVRPYVE